MRELCAIELLEARETARRLGRGDELTQSELDALHAAWEPRVQPNAAQRTERFAVCRPNGVTTGVGGPRWLFHLFGIRHRAVEIAFSTPAGLIVLQRRSPTKAEWPNALDMAVAGHVSQNEDGSDMSFEQAAWKEISEEIGLREQEASEVLVEGQLTGVGPVFCCYEGRPPANPPFLDAEARRIYAATLTGEGLARIRFADNEVSEIVLTTVEMAWEVLRSGEIASGLRYSLPRYLDWIEQRLPS